MENNIIEKARTEMAVVLRHYESKIEGVSKEWLSKLTVEYFETPTPLSSISNIRMLNRLQIGISSFDKGATEQIRTTLEKNGIPCEIKNNQITVVRSDCPEQSDAVNAYTNNYFDALQHIYTTALSELKQNCNAIEYSKAVNHLRQLLESYRGRLGGRSDADDDSPGSRVPNPTHPSDSPTDVKLPLPDSEGFSEDSTGD